MEWSGATEMKRLAQIAENTKMQNFMKVIRRTPTDLLAEMEGSFLKVYPAKGLEFSLLQAELRSRS